MSENVPNEELNKLIRSLGFDTNKVYDFRLIATANVTNAAVVVEVRQYAHKEDILKIQKYLEKYELSLKKESNEKESCDPNH